MTVHTRHGLRMHHGKRFCQQETLLRAMGNWHTYGFCGGNGRRCYGEISNLMGLFEHFCIRPIGSIAAVVVCGRHCGHGWAEMIYGLLSGALGSRCDACRCGRSEKRAALSRRRSRTCVIAWSLMARGKVTGFSPLRDAKVAPGVGLVGYMCLGLLTNRKWRGCSRIYAGSVSYLCLGSAGLGGCEMIARRSLTADRRCTRCALLCAGHAPVVGPAWWRRRHSSVLRGIICWD